LRICIPDWIRTHDLHGVHHTGRQQWIFTTPQYSQKVINNILENGEKGSMPEEVAGTIYKAATDNNKNCATLKKIQRE